MKKIVMLMAAAFIMSASVPVIAANHEMTKEQKDQCLLYSKKCATQVDTIQQRIKKLNQEVEKGTRVYSPQELQRLEQKLKEAQDILDTLEKPSGK